MPDSKVIILQGGLQGGPREDEQSTASEADIIPGMLIEMSSGQWRKHSTAAGFSARIFAGDRAEMGQDIDTAYAIGDRVKALYFGREMKVNALVGSGQNLAKGDNMESAGNGLLRKFTSGEIVGQADQDLDLTGLASTSRCRVVIV